MPHRLTLTQMAAEIRARRIGPVELVEAHLRRIDEVNPRLNAFVSVYADEARAAAAVAEAALRNGTDTGPLHGVPVTIKDSFDIEGKPTLCGSKFRFGHRAAEDATCVARLRRAGAVVLGKTNCPEFLYNYETDNYIAGRTNNPWDVARTPGGSSGGEAAAIASFCSAGGMGSDGGGSIRVPAHFCGIAGLKPTPGRVPAAGHFPLINHPGGLLGVGGPMARTVADVKALFEVTAGYDDQDPFSSPVPVGRPALDRIRVGVMPQFYNVPVQPAIRRAVEKAARVLADLRIPVEPFGPRGIERAPNLWWFFFGSLPAPFLREIFEGREQDAHWTGRELVDRAAAEPAPTARQTMENLAARDAMRAALLRQMRGFPVILTAACGVTAFPHRQRRWETGEKSIGLFEAMMPLTFCNLLGLPALVLPFDISDEGLPVGVQLVGAPYSEEVLLELGMRMEAARGELPKQARELVSP